MHFRTIVFMLSIGLNLVLAIGWARYYFQTSVYSRNPIIRNGAAGADRPEPASGRKPNTGSRNRFNWQNIESRDYPTYIQNLRSIGCPEETIRNIIVAEVEEQFAEQKERHSKKGEFAWWKSDPTATDAADHAQEKESAALENEKRALLTELLGPDWQKGDPNADLIKASNIDLEGSVLGDLSSNTKQKVYEIAARARRGIDAHAESQRFLGQPINPIHLAQLRREMRSELARILTPIQYEEFLLRYSETANQMRNELRGIDLTPEEFRNLFRSRDPLESELALLGGDRNGASGGRVAALESQVDGLMQQTLGPQRYAEYRLNQDPAYREARRNAEQLGLSADAAESMATIQEEYMAERGRIQADTSLTPDEKIDALAAIAAEQQKALLQLLGSEGFQRLQQAQSHR